MSTCARSGICLESVFFVENMVGDFGHTWGISGRSYYCMCCTSVYIYIYYVFKLCGLIYFYDYIYLHRSVL